MTKPLAAIFDVDGTLCDVSSVRWHVDLKHPRNRGYKDFPSFHEAATGCPAHQHVVGLTNALRPDITRIVVTARMRQWEKPTVWFLLLNEVRFDELYMRADKDQRPDYEIKRDLLDEIEEKYEVVLAVDDNPNVIRLWQERGIHTVTVPGWED